jgi:hypothetical protein
MTAFIKTRKVVNENAIYLPFQTATGAAAAGPDKRGTGGRTTPPGKRTT